MLRPKPAILDCPVCLTIYHGFVTFVALYPVVYDETGVCSEYERPFLKKNVMIKTWFRFAEDLQRSHHHRISGVDFEGVR